MMGRGLYRLCLLGFRDHAAPGKLLQIRVSQMRFPEFLGINKNIELLYTACRQAFAFAWTPFRSMGRSLNQRRRIYVNQYDFRPESKMAFVSPSSNLIMAKR